MSRHGKVWWDELTVWDPDAAQRFYAPLIGWSFGSMPNPSGDGTYGLIQNDGDPIGGVLKMTSPEMDGLPAHWMTYFAVDDIEAAAAAVREAGGSVKFGPFDIPQVGRILVIADPAEGVTSLIEPPAGEQGMSFPQSPGHMRWRELNTWDPAAATAFFEAVLGWRFESHPLPQGGQYHRAMRDGAPVAGVFPLTSPDFDGVPSSWLSYIMVADVDAAAARTAELGGAVIRPPFDAMPGERIAIIRDAAGAVVGLSGRTA